MSLSNVEQPKEKISGWLRFFFVMLIISACWMPLSILATMALPFISPEKPIFTLENLFINLELLPDLLFSVLMLKVIHDRNNLTPKKIKKLLRLEIWSKFFIAVAIMYAYKKGLVEDRPFPFIISAIYYFIWRAYFTKAKQVKSYYNLEQNKA